MPEVLSTKEVGDLLRRPSWQIRVVADELSTPIPRIGRQRAIPVSRVAEIAQAAEARYGKIDLQQEAAL